MKRWTKPVDKYVDIIMADNLVLKQRESRFSCPAGDSRRDRAYADIRMTRFAGA
jgi:hypothetical protein